MVKNKKIVKPFNWKAFALSFVIVIIVAFLGSLFTSTGTKSSWYQQIKPGITPPSFVFPIAWTILFILIALSLYFAWMNSKNKKDKTSIAWVFGINFVLNILWSAAFFGMRNPFLAFCDIILLWLSILVMMIVSSKISKASSYLLIPYFLWVTFAALLNFLAMIA